MDRIALQILEDGWEQDGRAMRRAVAFVTASLYTYCLFTVARRAQAQWCTAQGEPRVTSLEQAIDLIGRLTRGEKARLVRDIVSQLDESFPGIDTLPDVCGGEPCVVRTRIPVWLLVQTRRLGASEADLLRAYPTLRAQDLVETWAYGHAHPAEIEQQIRDNETA